MKEFQGDDYIGICQTLGNYCLTKLREGNIGCEKCISNRLNDIKKEYIDIMGHDIPGVDKLSLQNEVQGLCCTSKITTSFITEQD